MEMEFDLLLRIEYQITMSPKQLIIFFSLFSSPSYGRSLPEKLICQSGSTWVRPYFRGSYTRSDGTKVESSNVTGHCRKLTATSETWSARLLNSKPIEWPIVGESFKSWSLSEKERILEALEEMPQEFLNSKINSVHRAGKSKDFPNPATSADGIIVLYDNAFDSKNNLARILAHEFSHQIYRELSPKNKKEYGYGTNWIPLDPLGLKFLSRKDGFVQDDGRESPEEDFANNLEFFLFDPKDLEKLTPQASRWIKEHYHDNLKLRRGSKP